MNTLYVVICEFCNGDLSISLQISIYSINILHPYMVQARTTGFLSLPCSDMEDKEEVVRELEINFFFWKSGSKFQMIIFMLDLLMARSLAISRVY